MRADCESRLSRLSLDYHWPFYHFYNTFRVRIENLEENVFYRVVVLLTFFFFFFWHECDGILYLHLKFKILLFH